MGCGSSAKSKDKNLGNEFRGASCFHLRSVLLKEVNAKVGAGATLYDIEPIIILPKGAEVTCPRDGRKGASYVDSIYGTSHASSSTAMLSYTWGYQFQDIVDSLTTYCDKAGVNRKAFYVWMCCLCINQHRLKEAQARGETIPFSQFKSAFRRNFENVDHLLVLMTPWHAPQHITRVWCLFELFTAVSLGKDTCKVDIIMPPGEPEALFSAMVNGDLVEKLWPALVNLRIQDASASIEEDSRNIFEFIDQGPGGIDSLNSAVSDYLCKWVLQKCENMAHEKNASSSTVDCVQHLESLGRLLVHCGKGRLKDFAEARQYREQEFTMETVEGADLLIMMASVRAKKADLARALEDYQEARRVYELTDMLATPKGADLLKAIGGVKRRQADLDGALEEYVEARHLYEMTDTLETPPGVGLLMSTADLLSEMGGVKARKNDFAAALEDYAEARYLYERTDRLQTPPGAKLLTDTADLLIMIGAFKVQNADVEGALHEYEQARDLYGLTGMLQTKQGADLLRGIADIKVWQDAPDDAMGDYAEVRRLYDLTGTLETEQGAHLIMSIGDVRLQKHDLRGALQEYAEARRIYELTDTLDTRQGTHLLMASGGIKLQTADLEGALDDYEEVRLIYEQTNMLETQQGADLLKGIGGVKVRKADLVGAMLDYEEARWLYELTGTLETLQGAGLLTSIGDVKVQKGDMAGALEDYTEARQLHELAGTLQTPQGLYLRNRLSEAQSQVLGWKSGSWQCYALEDLY